jgi:hypothetical protein
MNGQRPPYFLAEAIEQFIYTKFYHWANNCGKYADGFCTSTIDNKNSHIPLPPIMLTSTALHHPHLESQKNKGVHPKASKLKLNVNRPDCSNYFIYKNDGGKNSSCCAATSRKLLTSPGVADTYTFLMNTWNTLLGSFQQRVYNNTLGTVQHQTRKAEIPTPAVVISVEAARVDNSIHLDYLASGVALADPEIRCTDPIITIDNICTDDNPHFGMTGGSVDYDDDGDESDMCDAIPTASPCQLPATELQRFDLEPSDVDMYRGKDSDDADADGEEESSQADDGSTQNVED